MKSNLAIFEDYKIRRLYDEETETWFFSVVDIIQVLIQQPDYQTARKYWNKLKERLKKEGSETVTNCHQLKMVADDGKMRLTDAANPETLLRLKKPGWNWKKKQANELFPGKIIYRRNPVKNCVGNKI